MLVILLKYYFISMFIVEASPELILNVIITLIAKFHRLII